MMVTMMIILILMMIRMTNGDNVKKKMRYGVDVDVEDGVRTGMPPIHELGIIYDCIMYHCPYRMVVLNYWIVLKHIWLYKEDIDMDSLDGMG
jgi:hypothetical protein